MQQVLCARDLLLETPLQAMRQTRSMLSVPCCVTMVHGLFMEMQRLSVTNVSEMQTGILFSVLELHQATRTW